MWSQYCQLCFALWPANTTRCTHLLVLLKYPQKHKHNGPVTRSLSPGTKCAIIAFAFHFSVSFNIRSTRLSSIGPVWLLLQSAHPPIPSAARLFQAVRLARSWILCDATGSLGFARCGSVFSSTAAAASIRSLGCHAHELRRNRS